MLLYILIFTYLVHCPIQPQNKRQEPSRVKKGWSQTENTMTWDLDAPSVYIIVEMGGIWNCIPRGVDCIAVVTHGSHSCQWLLQSTVIHDGLLPSPLLPH